MLYSVRDVANMLWVSSRSLRIARCTWLCRVVGVRRKSIIQTCDTCDVVQRCRVRSDKMFDSRLKALRFYEGVAPCAAVDVD